MSTQYVTRADLPRDPRGGAVIRDIQNAVVKAKQTVTSSGTSAVAATIAAVEEIAEVISILPISTAIWAKFGTGTPVAAVGSDHYCPAGVVSRFVVPQGYKLATIDA